MQSNKALTWITMSMAVGRKESPVPELLTFLDPEQIVTLVQVYGGRTIHIPTPQEFAKDMLAALFCYQMYVHGMSFGWCCEKYEVDGNKARSIKMIIDRWRDVMLKNGVDVVDLLKDAIDTYGGVEQNG